MTEDEAKTKWCPFFRLSITATLDGGTDYVGNRESSESTRADKCIGSGCMAWQKTDNESQPYNMLDSNTPPPSKPAGYCGLVGKR